MKSITTMKPTKTFLSVLLLAASFVGSINAKTPKLNMNSAKAPVQGILPVRVDNVTQPAVLLTKFTFDKLQVLEDWRLENFKAGMEPSELTIDQNDPHSGAASLKFKLNSGTNGQHYVTCGFYFVGDKPAVAGDRIRVRFFARTDAAIGDAKLQLLEKDAQKTLGWTFLDNNQDKILIDRGPGWAEYTAVATPRVGTLRITLFVSLANTATGRTVWIDDMSIEQISGGVKL